MCCTLPASGCACADGKSERKKRGERRVPSAEYGLLDNPDGVDRDEGAEEA